MGNGYLSTGQAVCYDPGGEPIPCAGSGQDAESCSGMPWPTPRFKVLGNTVLDHLTDLTWTRDANLSEFPMTWQEAFDYVAGMNHSRVFGHADWRLPNRRELRSLMSHQTRRPALPESHPFDNLFSGWYWSSTTAAIHPAYAWYVHMEGARMFYGGKDQSYLVWPVRGAGNGAITATGQRRCFDADGNQIPCTSTGQDGEFLHGRVWPQSRFRQDLSTVADRLTGLSWRRLANLTPGPVTWPEALQAISRLNANAECLVPWRLPNINELESLVDCSTHSPALPNGHPFNEAGDVYWSSTTSLYEPDWAWALYLDKGAVGVGQKTYARFRVWAVR